MKLQNTLDLSTFEIVRFRIWNQTSIPDDFGLGTKYFNTNSGHEGYNRENIYTATGWRRAAYMDDIEAITNGEGSLGTRVKTLEDMLGLEDVTDVIDTWNDVKAFFANVDEGLDLMTMLDGKLDKTGGTIRVSGYDGLTIASSIAGAAIKFKGTEATKGGYLIYSGGANWYVSDDGWTTSFKLIHTGNALDQLKGTFLPLTGGTVTGASADLLVINRSDGGNPWLTFKSGNVNIGRIGFDATTKELIASVDGAVKNVLHSGNVGDYAALKDGSNASGTWGIVAEKACVLYEPKSAGSIADVMTRFVNGGVIFAHTIPGDLEDMFPSESYANSMLTLTRHATSYARSQLGFSSNNIYYRSLSGDGTPTDWKTLAFTDSTVEAAKKLVKASGMTIIDLADSGVAQFYSGIAFLGGVKSIVWRIGEEDIKNIVTADGGDFILGNGGAKAGYNTYLDGNNIYFRAGTSNSTAMTITEGGNVNVGDKFLAGAKFSVYGGLSSFYVSGQTLSLAKLPSNGLMLGGNIYTLAQYLQSDGNFAIQSYNVQNSTALALNLNPLGGAVNIGEGGLKVAGIAEIEGNVLGIGGAKGANLLLKHTAGNHIWADAEGGYLLLGVKDAGNASASNASLSIYSDRVTPGARNNAVSLGISGWRWSNVYSVGGDFSGRVLIGGAQDDGETALQVKGAIALNSNNYIRLLHGSGSFEILGSANELNIESGNLDALYINYRKSSRGAAPKIWHWQAGSSTEYADFVLGHATFNAGALIPTGQSLTIGSVTFRETADGEVEVDGNLHTTGTLSSGGKAEEGEGGTGNAQVYQYELESGQSSYDVQNVKKNTNVIVQVYEWNSNTSSWDMILTDVSVKASGITVTFGRATTVNHLVTVC